MPSVNKVILVGHVGQDPTIRHAPSGDTIANASLATTERYKDKATGENKEQTEWHRLVFYGRVAEVVRDYVKKGRAVYVEGKLRTQKWTDKNNVERYTTEVVCQSVQLLDKPEKDQSVPADNVADAYLKAQGKSADHYANRPVRADDLVDDVPF